MRKVPTPVKYPARCSRTSAARYVLVGHSERRHYHAESDDLVALKFVVAQSAGLVPILCVGETLAERDCGATEAVIARQLDAVIARADIDAFSACVLAYEPVWAIGTGPHGDAGPGAGRAPLHP